MSARDRDPSIWRAQSGAPVTALAIPTVRMAEEAGVELYDYRGVVPSYVLETTEAAIAAADGLVAGAVRPGASRTFEDTLLPLDRATRVLARAHGRGAFLARVHPDPAVREAGMTADERIEKWQVALRAREDVDAAVREFAGMPAAAGLSGERRRFLDRWLVDLRRAGHGLDPRDRDELRRLRGRLVEIGVAFQRNLDAYDDGLDLTRDELDGLPDGFVERLGPGERPGTYHVGLAYPEIYPFLSEARRRDLRREMERRFLARAVTENRPLLEEALEVRRRIAALFGCPSWADYALEVKMARRPEVVERFYGRLVPALQHRAADELALLSAMLAAETGEGALGTWDVRYYDAQLLRRAHGIDAEEVAEYFPLERVLEGLLDVTGEVFGIRYRRIAEPRAWHEDVMAFEVVDAGTALPLAFFYADLFPREGKFSHAAAFPLALGHRHEDGCRARPVVAIVANLTAPSADRPALLRHEEVVTLFHEFGHVLAACLVDTELARFAGAETEWEADFVEAPSQILEHWAWEPDVLRRFARHHRTGAVIPAELVDRLVAARDVNIAYRTLRQCYMGLLDLAIHDATSGRDLDEANRAAHAVTGLDLPEGTFSLASFEHLFGGYDAGYYGYLWSKVYGDDMFSRFRAEGVMSAAVGGDYRRCILEVGDALDAADRLREFLGREPSDAAFLRGLGIEPDAPD